MSKLRFCSVLIWAALCLLVSGCSEHHRFGNDPPIDYPTDHAIDPGVHPGEYGSAFSGSFLSDPKTFNLWVADDADSAGIVGVLYDTLIGQDSFTLKYIPRLAYLPKISTDGLTYTFTLRPNLKWSDGQPITADDVIFTLDVIFDPSIVTATREAIEIPVKQPDGTFKLEPFKYKKIDDRTVQFKLPIKWAPALSIFSLNIAPKHALYDIYKAGNFNSAWGTDTPTNQLVASGPFIISKYVPGQRIVYARNPYFWRTLSTGQKLPFLDRFNYVITPDTDAMVLNFRSGACDSVQVPLQQYPALARYAHRDNYTMISRGTDWGFTYLCFNQNPNSVAMKQDPKLLKLFSNQVFRQACSYAIDRDALCNSVFLGLAQPQWAPITPTDVNFYDPKVKQYPFNLSKAREMLEEIGLKPGANGMLTYEGEPVKFNIITNVENQNRKACEVIVANNLRQIGLDVTYTSMAFNDMIRRVDAAPYDWQASISGFTGGPEPQGVASLWRSDGQYHQWWPNEKTPSTPWEAKIDQDFNNGASVLDIKKRKAFYDNFQEIIGQQQPVIFLVVQNDYTAVRNHYGNIKPSAIYSLGGDVYWNLEEVYDTHTSRQSP